MTSLVEQKEAEATSAQSRAPVSSANIAPNVVLSILDHHARRGEKQTRVLGGLYGILRSDIVEIRHVIPILHVEVEGEDATFELGGWQKMQQLGRKINLPPLIGWYATGSQPGDMSIDHMFSMRTAIYVRLIMDGSLENGGLRIRALGSVSTTIGGSSFKMYKHIPYRFMPSNCVESALLQKVVGDIFPELQVLSSPDGSVLGRLLREVESAIELVQKGAISSDVEFELLKAMETLPKAGTEKLRQMLTSAVQDATALKFLVQSISMILRVAGKVIN